MRDELEIRVNLMTRLHQVHIFDLIPYAKIHRKFLKKSSIMGLVFHTESNMLFHYNET